LTAWAGVASVLDMTTRRQQHRKPRLHSCRAAPPYREIQKLIGEGLREQLQLPKELPHQLLAVLLQLTENDTLNNRPRGKRKNGGGRRKHLGRRV
jgi:hypothetical protein